MTINTNRFGFLGNPVSTLSWEQLSQLQTLSQQKRSVDRTAVHQFTLENGDGEQTEAAVVSYCSMLAGVTKATTFQRGSLGDIAGLDVWLEVDGLDLTFQVKSSRRTAELFMERGGGKLMNLGLLGIIQVPQPGVVWVKTSTPPGVGFLHGLSAFIGSPVNHDLVEAMDKLAKLKAGKMLSLELAKFKIPQFKAREIRHLCQLGLASWDGRYLKVL